jgi:cytochrome bd ubiquinol oxidase subunit II
MEFQVIWFVLWAVLWAVYFMLDGFVLGVGILHNFIGRNDSDKRVLINTVGPVWDGNEVWLITAGGATFAAFPGTYALMFSYLYTALFLLLIGLIIRGVSFEFRGKMEGAGWKKAWDGAILFGSFIPALLFGVAFGNIFSGFPMDGAGYHGSLLTLLNPYGLLAGALFVLMFAEHGALYLSVKTEGEIKTRAHAMANGIWPVLLVVAAAFLIYTNFATRLYVNYFSVPLLWAVPLAAVAALVCVRLFSAQGKLLHAFTASCLTVVLVVATGVIGLFPNLIPSTLDPAFSLTIFNTSSSQYTLKIMTGVALIFVPIVIAYKIWVYRVFRGVVRAEDVLQDKQAY